MQFCKISISIKYRIDSNLAYRTGLSGEDVVKHEDGEEEYKVKDEEKGEVEVEEHLKEIGGSHELEDVPGLDRQLLRRAVVQVLHHLQGRVQGNVDADEISDESPSF